MNDIVKLFSIFLNNITCKLSLHIIFKNIYERNKSTKLYGTHHKMYHSFKAYYMQFCSFSSPSYSTTTTQFNSVNIIFAILEMKKMEIFRKLSFQTRVSIKSQSWDLLGGLPSL